MLLKSFRATHLHGSLNLNLSFKPDLTLLVGINGSGKTSVLNMLDAILKPDLPKLAVTDFSEIEIELENEGKAYVINATRAEKLITLSVVQPQLKLRPITINLDERNRSYDPDVERNPYDSLSFEPHEMPLADLLKSFARPTVISLDRTLEAESDNILYKEPSTGAIRRKQGTKSPLARVAEVTSNAYSIYRAKTFNHDNQLKARIVMSALQDPDAVFKADGKLQPMASDEITQLEQKVVRFLSTTIKGEEVATQIHRFFDSSRHFAEQPVSSTEEKNSLVTFVLAQYRQIDNLAKAFNDFETKNAAAFAALRSYLAALNTFFSDSGKEVAFNQSTGRLMFSYKTSASRFPRLPKREISQLASGEKQILILFTFLAFIAKEDSVFIVDEPELSLHP